MLSMRTQVKKHMTKFIYELLLHRVSDSSGASPSTTCSKCDWRNGSLAKLRIFCTQFAESKSSTYEQ
jgi:hypothetical protein